MNSSFSQFPLLLRREHSFFGSSKSFNLTKCKAFLVRDTQGDLEQHTKVSAQGPVLCTYRKQRHLCVKRATNPNKIYLLGIRRKSKSQSIADRVAKKGSNSQISKYWEVRPDNTHIQTLSSMQWKSPLTPQRKAASNWLLWLCQQDRLTLKRLKTFAWARYLLVNPIILQRHRPSCETQDVSLTSSIRSITCIRLGAGVTGSTEDQTMRLNYPWGKHGWVVHPSTVVAPPPSTPAHPPAAVSSRDLRIVGG